MILITDFILQTLFCNSQNKQSDFSVHKGNMDSNSRSRIGTCMAIICFQISKELPHLLCFCSSSKHDRASRDKVICSWHFWGLQRFEALTWPWSALSTCNRPPSPCLTVTPPFWVCSGGLLEVPTFATLLWTIPWELAANQIEGQCQGSLPSS